MVGLYFNPLKTEGTGTPVNNTIIQAKVGQSVYIRYSGDVITRIQNLQDKNSLRLEASSELHNTNLGGLRGELRYTKMTVEYVQSGRQEKVDEKDFETIEFRFLPDAGNKTTYRYENVDFRSFTTDSQLVATFVPLSTTKVGQQYKVNIFLDEGVVTHTFNERVIEIVE